MDILTLLISKVNDVLWTYILIIMRNCTKFVLKVNQNAKL